MPEPKWLSPRSILLLVVLLLVTLFAALNWSTLEEPAPLDFLILELEAPLGVLLLLAVAVFTLLFLALIAQMEASARGERRRLLGDLERWRDLAEKAEASRITELREVMEAGFDDLYDRVSRLGDDRGPRPAASREPSSAAEVPASVAASVAAAADPEVETGADTPYEDPSNGDESVPQPPRDAGG